MTVTKRRTNGAKQHAGPESESPFVNIPWGRTQDEHFDTWLDSNLNTTLESLVDAFLSDGLSVKIGQQGDSVYCTVDDKEAAQTGSKHLLSGWSDSCLEACQIAWFKWESLLSKAWDHPTEPAAKSRRR